MEILSQEFFGYLNSKDEEKALIRKLNTHRYLDKELGEHPSYTVKCNMPYTYNAKTQRQGSRTLNNLIWELQNAGSEIKSAVDDI